jgi:NADPH:quinone reductase-like Zn-dependent oxidoreductase
MFAVSAARTDARNPLSGLRCGERAVPAVPDGWALVTVRAAALNHHDLWTLRGAGAGPARLPVILGSDAAGVDEQGNAVVVHAVIGDPAAGDGDETLDPRRTILSEGCDGTFAELVAVPRRNLLPKPPGLSFPEAACLPGAWLTAFRMLFDKARLPPGGTVLVQGAGGGVTTALVVLGAAAGYRVWVTSRREDRRERVLTLGADRAFAVGDRLPERVDVVMETVGEATWAHSLASVRPGGRVVVAGATTGPFPAARLNELISRQVSVLGCTLGTRQQLARLIRFCAGSGARPVIDRVLPLRAARQGFAAMAAGELFGKLVFTVHDG